MIAGLYLSPHLDDAVFSCGGQIHRTTRTGGSVLVVTPMAGDGRGPGPAGAASPASRREEDRAACAELGAAWRHGEHPEAFRRVNPEGAALYGTRENLFGAMAAADEALCGMLEEEFRGLPPALRVFAPLGVGGHTDHRLVRRAAERAFGERLVYYEDFPYANRIGAVARLTRPRSRWRPEVIRLMPEDRAARLRAIRRYASQWPVVFRSRRALAWKNRLFLLRRGGERVWRRCPAESPGPAGPEA